MSKEITNEPEILFEGYAGDFEQRKFRRNVSKFRSWCKCKF
ncbi:hypothetical protein [Liquorilactobacillus hordei]|nr:hypothetical protein [Liquorilactobacillus hordei]